MRTDELVRMLATGLEPVPPGLARRRWLLALSGGLLAAVLLMLLTLGPLADLAATARVPMFWVKLGMPLALLAIALGTVQRLAIPGAPSSHLLPLLALPVLLLWALAGSVLLSAPPDTRAALVMGETWRVCPALIVGLALPTFGGAVWALRGLAPTRLRLTGFVAGLLAGSVGALVYAFHCPELAAPFVATWYVLGMLLPAAAGALTGPWLLRW